MENQDKIFEQLKGAAQKAETKDFPAMEKVWNRVEEKLDKKEDKKVIVLWKKLAIAASLLLFFSLGYQFFKSGDHVAPNVTPEKEVVIAEPTDSTVKKSVDNAVVGTENDNPILKKDAGQILQEQVSKPSEVVVDNSPEHYFKTHKVKFVQPPRLVKTPSLSEKDVEESVNKESAFTKEPVAVADANANELVTQSRIAETAKLETVTTTNPVTGLQTISGVVSDATGTLPGANVVVKGTTRGVQTDVDGKFQIDVKKGEQLIVSFIGMSDAVATVGNTNKMNIMLQPGAVLSEVVVDGYKSTSKRKSSVSQTTVSSEQVAKSKRGKRNANAAVGNTTTGWTISQAPAQGPPYKSYRGHTRDGDRQGNQTGTKTTASENAEGRPNASFIQSLQGQVAGLNMNEKGRTDVIIRGASSVNGQTEPLYIVNGVPVDAAAFNSLNPEKIQGITVLKNASATALYGSRGANGVIVIQTTEGLSKREIRKMKRAIKKAKKQHPQTEIQQAPQPQVEVATQEDYDSFVENPFESPKNAPLSTFSIDVDNAAYTNVRRFINNGQAVPKDAVRVEEMVNFFRYQYPQPTDNNPFSINTEYSDCPWNSNHKLLKIGLQGKDIAAQSLPASNLVFLIDVSGSMNEQNKLPLLVESMKILVSELREKDKVAIVVYAGAAGLVLPPTSGNDKQTIISALEKLNAGGSTAGGAGIELAYKIAGENFIKGGNNRVILATDGDFNVGSASNTDMQTLIEEKRKSGVFLTCLGYGMGNYKDSKMEILADKGNGNYAYIDNIQEANRFLGKEFKGSMFAIAKDVKIQIEFNPLYVQSYRLIGYENRKLRAEDFKNDAIDAGELGSGHTVTALYEVIPAGVKSKFLEETDGLKFTKSEPVSADFNNQLAFIKFRYKKPDGNKSIEMEKFVRNEPVPLQNSSSDFKFSAAVAWFGLKLRDSKLVENKASEAIKNLAQQGLSNDTEGYKAEFVRLVEAVK